MRCRLIVLLAVLACVVGWIGSSAVAQTSAGSTRGGGTLLERLDEFGRSLLGGTPSSGDKEGASTPAPAKPKDRQTPTDRLPDEPSRPRAGSVLRSEQPPWTPPDKRSPPATPSLSTPVRPFTQAPPEDQSPMSVEDRPASRPFSGDPKFGPLHQRLSGLRQLTFDEGARIGTEPRLAERPAVSGTTADTTPRSDLESRPLPAANSKQEPRPSLGPSASLDGRAELPAISPRPATPPAATNAAPASSAPATNPARANPAPADEVPMNPTRPNPAAAGLMTDRARRAEPTAAAAAGAPELFTRQSPSLSVDTVGPRRIAVKKEAIYEVNVRNSGPVAAEQVVVVMDLPEWIELVRAETAAGTTESAKGKDSSTQLRWRVGRLEAKGCERLLLRIAARQSRPFDLAAKWDYSQPPPSGMIEVQEPKLAIVLHGPREVLFGKGEIFRLEVANVGTGSAENVAISLTPITPSEKPTSATHQFGLVAAGQKKSIDVELTARQTGDLEIQIEARAEGGVRAELAEKILVRRAMLKAEIDAPKIHFVGSEAAYRVRVANPGTAPATNVLVTATLPSGTKFLSSPQGARLSPDQSKVIWSLTSVAVGAETTLEMVCGTSVPGVSRLEVDCKADGDLSASAVSATQVEALANLVLAVEDPGGPVLMEGEATYQVKIQNRGSASASAVDVVVYFSQGFEPISAEGGKYKLGPGQVVFEPIPSLAAGQSATFRIKAKAEAPGNHVFRVEVRSDPIGTRLVREGTTRFFSTSNLSSQPQIAPVPSRDKSALGQSGDKTAPVAESQPRTADRRDAPSASTPDSPGGSAKPK